MRALVLAVLVASACSSAPDQIHLDLEVDCKHAVGGCEGTLDGAGNPHVQLQIEVPCEKIGGCPEDEDISVNEIGELAVQPNVLIETNELQPRVQQPPSLLQIGSVHFDDNGATGLPLPLKPRHRLRNKVGKAIAMVPLGMVEASAEAKTKSIPADIQPIDLQGLAESLGAPKIPNNAVAQDIDWDEKHNKLSEGASDTAILETQQRATSDNFSNQASDNRIWGKSGEAQLYRPVVELETDKEKEQRAHDRKRLYAKLPLNDRMSVDPVELQTANAVADAAEESHIYAQQDLMEDCASSNCPFAE